MNWMNDERRCRVHQSRGTAAAIVASDLPAVIGPVQNRLPLPTAAVEVALVAVLPDRRNMPRDRPPSSNLSRVVARPPAHEVPAVPLEPPAWILRMNPTFAAPLGERL